MTDSNKDFEDYGNNFVPVQKPKRKLTRKEKREIKNKVKEEQKRNFPVSMANIIDLPEDQKIKYLESLDSTTKKLTELFVNELSISPAALNASIEDAVDSIKIITGTDVKIDSSPYVTIADRALLLKFCRAYSSSIGLNEEDTQRLIDIQFPTKVDETQNVFKKVLSELSKISSLLEQEKRSPIPMRRVQKRESIPRDEPN